LSNDHINELLGDDVLDIDLTKYSPVHYVDESSPETLILHGTEDLIVPINQSYILTDSLVKNNVDVTLLEYDGFIHGLLGLTKEDKDEILVEVRSLIWRNLE
jgi:dipeptidyl aminopeptidase/acylaminoacyl peptidase